MLYSELVEMILNNEKEIRKDLEKEKSSPESIIYAYISYFDKPYLGLTKMNEDYPIPFEEERSRLLLSKILVSSIHLSSRLFLREVKIKTSSIDYLSSLYTKAEMILKQRNQSLLSSDIVLALCIQDLENLKPIKAKYHQFDILSLLNEVDQEIYPYVIENVEQVKVKLQEKIDKAIAYRDYAPASKFVDEATLQDDLNHSVQLELKDNLLMMRIPFFFKDSKDPLVLSVIKKENMYYIHDHGCAIKELNKRIESKEECIQKANSFVSGTICHFNGDILIGSLNSLPYFSRYLQRLTMIANLDLINDCYSVMPDYERENVYPFVGQDDLSEIVNYISNYFKVDYDKNQGLLVSSHLCYFGNATTASYLIKTNKDIVSIYDHYNRYTEGAIFENIWYNVDDLTPYSSYINKVVERFGGQFDGKEVSLSFNIKDSFIKSFFNFIQMAILLAPMNDLFELDKLI